jgi:glutaredoxin-like protein NrdH
MAYDITVYTSPGCQPCRATIRKLNQLGIEYNRIDVTQDDEALAYIKGLGYLQAPVIVAGDDHWGDYRPHLIEQLAADVSDS